MSSFSIDHLAKYVFRQLYGFFVLQRDLSVSLDELSWKDLETKLLQLYFPEITQAEEKWDILKTVIRRHNTADNVKNFVLKFYKHKSDVGFAAALIGILLHSQTNEELTTFCSGTKLGLGPRYDSSRIDQISWENICKSLT